MTTPRRQAAAPVTISAQPVPAWTTSEFWSAAMVHLFAVSATLLTFFTGTDHGVEGAEAVIPAAALIASALAHVAYSHGRVQLRVAHVERLAGDAASLARAAGPVVKDLAPGVEAAETGLASRIAAADAAGRSVEDVPSSG